MKASVKVPAPLKKPLPTATKVGVGHSLVHCMPQIGNQGKQQKRGNTHSPVLPAPPQRRHRWGCTIPRLLTNTLPPRVKQTGVVGLGVILPLLRKSGTACCSWGEMVNVEMDTAYGNKEPCWEEDLKSPHRNEEFSPASNTSAGQLRTALTQVLSERLYSPACPQAAETQVKRGIHRSSEGKEVNRPRIIEESQHSVKQNRLRLWSQDSIIQANSRNKHSSHTEITNIRKVAQHTRTDKKKKKTAWKKT